MDRKAILLNLRNEGKLKGLKPSFVTLRTNAGKIYNGGSGTFIMTIRDNILHFQKLSFLFHRLVPADDFSVNAKRFKEYKVIKKTGITLLYFYDEEGRYLPIFYQTGSSQTFSSEENIDKIIKEFEKNYGLRMEAIDDGEEDSESKGEGSN